MKLVLWVVMFAGLAGCARRNEWKLEGPPQCEQMCSHWKLQFAALVAVGDQAPDTYGATGCVCVPAQTQPAAASATAAAGATASSLAAPVALAAAQAVQQASSASAARRRADLGR